MSSQDFKTDEYWKEKLSPEQFEILRKKSTEAPFSGELLSNKEEGVYKCMACKETLFTSETKYNSGSGWPSFYDVLDSGKVDLIEDTTHGMKRTEVVCSNCKGHLGHLFEDGPSEHTGIRYCINSASLDFDKREE